MYDNYVMSNKGDFPALTLGQSRVLAAIRDGAQTWDEIKAATGLNDDHLGQVLGGLFSQRKVRTGERNGVRVYWLVDTRLSAAEKKREG